MATEQERKNMDFHLSGPELFISLVLGVVVVACLWLFSGLLMMLFLM